jgi:dipeptidyl aminopeptidase/acylaminoacyl peptidase
MATTAPRTALPTTTRRRGVGVLVVGSALALSFGAGVAPASADGSAGSLGTIAFVSERTGNDELYLLDVATLQVRQLTDSPGFDRAPGWSPDGTSLAFNSRREPHPDRPQIYVLDVATGQQSRVTDSPLEEQRATWAPDGTGLYFHRGAFLTAPYNLVHHELATGTETVLTDSTDPGVWNAAPAPRPGAAQVLFQSNRDDATSVFPQTLQLLDLETLAVTAIPSPVPGASIDGPRWNSDGTAATFSVSGDEGNTLYVADPATWTHTAVTDALSEDSAPAFSPDGSMLVFQTHVEGETEDEDRTVIRTLDLETGEIVELGEGRTPVWTATAWFGNESTDPQLAATGAAVTPGLLAVGFAAVAAGLLVSVRTRGRARPRR